MPQLLCRSPIRLWSSTSLSKCSRKQSWHNETLGKLNVRSSSIFHTGKTDIRKPFALCRLHSRSLLRLAGTEADDFLQGIITNDIRLLAGSRCDHPVRLSRSDDELLPSIYTLCLNVQGRVLFDVILYRFRSGSTDNTELLLEHDASISASVRNHLRMYKLRRSIDIDDDTGNRMHVWALVNQQQIHGASVDDAAAVSGRVLETLRLTNDRLQDDCFIFRDPRPVKQLGFRLIIPSSLDVIKSLQLNKAVVSECELSTNELTYQRVLYENGVGEGCQDLLPGKSFPLECNADYLHGVSFEKGCYIGQELTARTFHTGVVRKRLMPISFDSQECHQLLNDENSRLKVIINSSVSAVDEAGGEKVLGKVRNVAGANGLALLRIEDAIAAKKVEVQLSDGKKHVVRVNRPLWWPAVAESIASAGVVQKGADMANVSEASQIPSTSRS